MTKKKAPKKSQWKNSRPKRKSNAAREEAGTYVSKSTIDNPPTPERDEEDETTEDAEQQSLIPEAESAEEVADYLDGNPVDRQFGIELKLTLKPGGKGKAITIPLLAGEFEASRIPELLMLGIMSRKNARLIDSALDLPVQAGAKIENDRAEIRSTVHRVTRRTVSTPAIEPHAGETLGKIGKALNEKKAKKEKIFAVFTDANGNGALMTEDVKLADIKAIDKKLKRSKRDGTNPKMTEVEETFVATPVSNGNGAHSEDPIEKAFDEHNASVEDNSGL